MLDFYVISDSEAKPKPDKLEELKHAGFLSSDTFERLVRKGIIAPRFDYYSDFRWGNKLLVQIDTKMRAFPEDSDVQALQTIIGKALKKESGLIAYGD